MNTWTRWWHMLKNRRNKKEVDVEMSLTDRKLTKGDMATWGRRTAAQRWKTQTTRKTRGQNIVTTLQELGGFREVQKEYPDISQVQDHQVKVQKHAKHTYSNSRQNMHKAWFWWTRPQLLTDILSRNRFFTNLTTKSSRRQGKMQWSV